MSIDIHRDSINRLSREKANLEKSLGQEKEKLIRVKSSIASISRSITKYTSASMVNFKQRQIETKEKETVRIQKKIADIESKIVRKAEDITRNPKIAPENAAQFWRYVGDGLCSASGGIALVGGYHGGGSPVMEQIAITTQYDIEARKTMVKKIAGIDDKLNKKRLGSKHSNSSKVLVPQVDEVVAKK